MQRSYLAILLVACSMANITLAQEPATDTNVFTVMPTGQQPPDVRLGPLKTLDGHFPMRVPKSEAEWTARSEELRNLILVSTGLSPMPERTPLDAVVHGRMERDGFSIERVYFQSLPGHYVTGLLFRPTGKSLQHGNPKHDKRAGVLCPHGHGGRMQRFSDKEILDQIASGAERFVASGQTPKLARCATLARMGCVTFIFDMLGYGDSQQISYETAHRHAALRPEDRRPENGSRPDSWPLFSTDAELRLQTAMGLQTWNSIRALDFLASLPDVDTERLGVTGGSGGGTQTIILGAIDPRVKVSFPNGMVSTSMQGGCYCENVPLLRVNTGNVELAALMAPRPMACTAANDWTKDMLTDGYPQLQQLYRLVGDINDVQCADLLNFPHNFNYVSRSVMYPWFNRYLGLGIEEPIVEEDFAVISDQDGEVFSGEHQAPSQVGIEHERAVCHWLDSQATTAIADWWPNEPNQVAQSQTQFRQAWRTILSLKNISPPYLKTTNFREFEQVPGLNGATMVSALIGNSQRESTTPFVLIHSTEAENDEPSKHDLVVWLRPGGKQSLNELADDERALLQKLVDAGVAIMVADVLGQGELSRTSDTANAQRLIADNRPFAAFSFGYNRTLMAERVADAIDAINYAHSLKVKSLFVLGTGDVAPVALAASALGEASIARTAIMLDGFRFADAPSYASPDFVPGSVKYGDVETLLALVAPRPLLVRDSGDFPINAAQAYALQDAREELVTLKTTSESLPTDELIEFFGY